MGYSDKVVIRRIANDSDGKRRWEVIGGGERPVKTYSRTQAEAFARSRRAYYKKKIARHKAEQKEMKTGISRWK